MDRMKLPATTIVETVTAALLVMVSLGIGLAIYMNILKSEQLVARVKAQAILSRMAEETAFGQRFVTETVHEEGLTIEKRISPYSIEYPDAILLTLTAYGGQQEKLCEQKEILYPDPVQ